MTLPGQTRITQAFCLETGSTIAPFGEKVGESLVLGQTLCESQEAALRRAGLNRVETPPTDQPYLVYTDRCWFTSDAIRRFVASGAIGRAALDHEAYLLQTRSLQTDPQHPEIAIIPRGAPPSLEGPLLPLDLNLRAFTGATLHPAMAHAQPSAPVGSSALIHGIEHWSHLLRVNLLAMLARTEEFRLDFEAWPWWRKVAGLVALLWRSKGFSIAKLARGLSRIGKNCRIHPTAVVEGCELADEVEVGPHAVLRGCTVGRGARIEPHAVANLAVIGAGARLSQGAYVNLCVLLPGALVSRGNGFQMSVFGRDSFVAVGATILDLSFGRAIRVDHSGERVDTESHFLGACVGHRARVGQGVRIGYGSFIPNDALLVAPPDDVLKRWPEDLMEPACVRDGVATAVKPASSES